jgi:hypothetical protein
VRAALEQAATLSCADVFSFEHVINGPRCGMQRSLLALDALTLRSLALTSATSLVAGVTATIQRSPANTHALRRLSLALVADRLGRGATTSALNADSLLAVTAVSSMADLFARVTA